MTLLVEHGEYGDAGNKHLRKMPELRFFLDDSLDRYEEIDRLLTDD